MLRNLFSLTLRVLFVLRRILSVQYTIIVNKLCLPCIASAEPTDKNSFLNEIELMKIIAKRGNPFVVSIVGCVTLQEPLCLFTEFVAFGNLEVYFNAIKRMVCSMLLMELTPSPTGFSQACI